MNKSRNDYPRRDAAEQAQRMIMFSYNGRPVGDFLELPAAGEISYMPFRGMGHLKFVQALALGETPVCEYELPDGTYTTAISRDDVSGELVLHDIQRKT